MEGEVYDIDTVYEHFVAEPEQGPIGELRVLKDCIVKSLGGGSLSQQDLEAACSAMNVLSSIVGFGFKTLPEIGLYPLPCDVRLHAVLLSIRFLLEGSVMDSSLKNSWNLYALTYRFIARFVVGHRDIPSLFYEDVERYLDRSCSIPTAKSSYGNIFTLQLLHANELEIPAGKYALKLQEKDTSEYLLYERNVQFETESTALKDMDYPFIVRLFATVVSKVEKPKEDEPLGQIDLTTQCRQSRYSKGFPKKTGFILEFLDGKDVEVSAKEFDLWKIVSVSKEMAIALYSLHIHDTEFKMFHGDIKPQNFCLTGVDKHVKLIDFGYCGTDVGRDLDSFMGYLEPPRPSNTSHIAADCYADIYSLGMCFVSLITGMEIKSVNGVSVQDQLIAKCLGQRDTLVLVRPNLRPQIIGAQREVALGYLELATSLIDLNAPRHLRNPFYLVVNKLAAFEAMLIEEDVMTALQIVLRNSRAHGGLVKGLRQVTKAIEKNVAQLCVLAKDCDEPDIVEKLRGL